MGFWGAIKGLFSFVFSLVNYSANLSIQVGLIAAIFFIAKYGGTVGAQVIENKQKIVELVYWRDPKKSGIAFGATLIVLLCLASFSLISVVAYLGLLLLAATISFRVYKSAMATLNKGDQQNPFKPYLEKDLSLPEDRVHAQVDVCLTHAQDAVHQLRRLILVEDFLDTAKFAVLLWALTYVGAWFSGMALLILALIGVFTIPKFYEMYQPQIDEYWAIAAGHIKNVTDQIEANVPFLKKKEA